MSLKQVLIAIDQLVNTLAGGFADETLSARAYREKRTVLECFINTLFLDGNHCLDSYLSEQQRKQLPEEYRADL